jgi:hypothetical protein
LCHQANVQSDYGLLSNRNQYNGATASSLRMTISRENTRFFESLVFCVPFSCSTYQQLEHSGESSQELMVRDAGQTLVSGTALVLSAATLPLPLPFHTLGVPVATLETAVPAKYLSPYFPAVRVTTGSGRVL